eukprot:NODE_177_length_2813_cov_48.393894_g163_i0.p1 GENE.NODE_177_length_2813_cov_48.393894_g163_i0~~NODE_177_length_2813_cov_48.393894_g163_i0.p1  ORF type:complete len:881 (-),score=293.27 NODE_177_length_2813_cov_48.393894_g163_i0:169-2751(-)
MLVSDPMLIFAMKRTDQLDWAKPLKAYVKQTINPQEAEGLTETLEQMNRLRKAVRNVAEGKEALGEHLFDQVFAPYMCLLQHASAHFPLVDGQVKVVFGWYDVLYRKKSALSTLTLERGCLLFNMAALHQALGVNENRVSADGIKSAFKHFQQAAGFLEATKDLFSTLTDRLTPDLSSEGLGLFTTWALTSAAHHCSYLKAQQEMSTKHMVLSKLAMEASAMYQQLHQMMCHPAVAEVVDKRWLAYCQFYTLVMEARADYHLANERHQQDAIGEELARLGKVEQSLAAALPYARSLDFSVFLQSFVDIVKAKKDSVQTENEKIYHERVPKLEALKPAERYGKTMAKAIPAVDFLEQSTTRDPFTHITPVHILQAKQAFNSEILSLVQVKSSQTRAHREAVKEALTKLGIAGLLASFDDQDTGLPKALQERITAIRVATGGSCVEHLTDRQATLKSLCANVKNTNTQLQCQLLGEAKIDRELRSKFGGRWSREPSEVVNRELLQTIADFKTKLEQAEQGDKIIEGKVKAHFDDIAKLDWDRDRLESTLPMKSEVACVSTTANQLARELTAMMQQMEANAHKEEGYLTDLQEMLQSDESELSLQLAAAGKEGQEHVLGEVRKRYEEKLQFLIQLSIESDNHLKHIGETCQQLMELRKGGSTSHRREEAINYLDSICNQFEEIASNFKEGINFYATMSDATERQKNKVEDFIFARNVQKDDLLNTIQREAAHIETTQELMENLKQLEIQNEAAKKAFQQEQREQEQRRQLLHHQQAPNQPYLYQPQAPPAYNPQFAASDPRQTGSFGQNQNQAPGGTSPPYDQYNQAPVHNPWQPQSYAQWAQSAQPNFQNPPKYSYQPYPQH